MQINLKNILPLSFALVSYSVCNAQETTGKETLSNDEFPIPEIKIKLPSGPAFEFCIAPLQVGDSPFATREIWLGGRGGGGFKEPLTRSLLAGSIIMRIAEKDDWCIVIGKTEVTVEQWYGVLGLPIPDGEDGAMPITRVSRADVAVFLEKANEQLKSAEADKVFESPIPTNFENAFLRLPTESEWEFCARGGLAVSSTRFDNPTPYEGRLNQYEWFFGQDSSRGRLKQVALLKPNPLGIYDMLGNASEMVEYLYQVEYSQGRIGGGVIRGGDFRTEQADLRSAMRIEVPWIFPDGKAYRSGTVGFRLALGTVVIQSMAQSERLEDEWEQHTKTRIQPQNISPSESSVSAMTNNELEEISELMKGLAQKFQLGESDEMTTQQRIELMEARIANIRGSMKRSDDRFAEGAVILASIVSMNAVQLLSGILLYEQSLEDPHMPDRIKEVNRIALARNKNNVREASIRIEKCMKMLDEIPKEVVENAFSEHTKRIEELMKSEDDRETLKARIRQIDSTQVTKNTIFEYMNHKRVNMDEWEKNLMHIVEKWRAENEQK